MDTAVVNAGKYAARISSTSEGSALGSVAYKIPANYAGQSIKLEGWMKTQEVANGFAGLLMRIDGGGTSLAFDNMQKQNITGTNDWQQYTITLPYPEGAETIFVAGSFDGQRQSVVRRLRPDH